MQRMRYISFLTFTAVITLTLTACGMNFIQPEERELKSTAVKSIIRVTVTSQGYHFHRPWQQRRPTTQTAIGAKLLRTAAKLVAIAMKTLVS